MGMIPNQLHWGGVNDRFAYGDHASMLFAYMSQFDSIYGTENLQLITSEELLCKHLTNHQVRVGVTPVCNVRVRASGIIEAIDLRYPPSWPEECCGLRFIAIPGNDNEVSCPEVSNICGYVNDPHRCVETVGAPNRSSCKLRRGRECVKCVHRNSMGDVIGAI